MSPALKTIHIHYFAILREQRGVSHESLQTAAVTAKDLYETLQKQFSFTLSLDMVKVAINQCFQPMETPLKEADHVVFIPPVAGG